MKIVFFAEELSEHSGWGRYSIDLIHTLQVQGMDVLVFCHKKNPTIDICQVEILPNPLAFKRILFQYFSQRTLFRNALKKSGFAPDLVHCLVEPYAPIANALSRGLGVPLIITAHGSFAVRAFASSVQGFLQARAYRHAYATVCISDYTRKRLQSYTPHVRTVVIPNGVQLSKDGAVHRTLTKPLLLSVGALKERKGFLHVLRALPAVVQKIPDLTYVMVGDQNDVAYTRQLRETVSSLHLEHRIEFKQRISDDELDELYRHARAFVLTPVSSPFSFEGFGLVYLEANARGVPVVGSYDNGGEEAIQDGKTGFLTKPADAADIAEKLITLLTMAKDEYVAMSQGCVGWAQAHAWEIIARRYADLYQEAMI